MELGTLFLFSEVNDQFGAFAEALYWEDGLDPELDPPTLIGFDGVVSATSGGLSGSVTMFDEATGEPAGDLSFEAAFTPIGDPELSSDRGRDGNHWFRPSGTSQAQEVTGSAALDEVGDFDRRTGRRRRDGGDDHHGRECACVVLRQPVR